MAQTTVHTPSNDNCTSKTNVSASSKNQNRECFNDNFIVFWITTDLTDLESIEQLRQTINTVHIFDHADECINQLTDIQKEKIFFILPEHLCHDVMPLIHQYSQIKYIYILNLEKQEKMKTWSEQYRKIRGIYEDISSLFIQMGKDARQYSNSLVSMSVIAPDTVVGANKNEQEASFMYSRLLKEIFINMETTDEEVNIFLTIVDHYSSSSKRTLTFV